MPVKRSLYKDPAPDEGVLLKLLRAVESMGLNPGDLMGGLGTAAAKRGGKLLRFPGGGDMPPTNPGDQMLRNHLSPKFQNEFDLMSKVPTKPELPHDEVRKMLDLLDPKPKK